tara:strand:+ start:986 stop:1375 length:390 start_codon:yes stop_codon:yes gene_type:complete
MPKQLKGNRKPIPKGNKGLAKLKKVAPQVVAKMGYKKGGLAASLKKLKRSQGSSIEGEISPRMKRRIDQKIKEEKEKNKNVSGKTGKQGRQGKQRTPSTPPKPQLKPRFPRTTPRGRRVGRPKGRVYNI